MVKIWAGARRAYPLAVTIEYLRTRKAPRPSRSSTYPVTMCHGTAEVANSHLRPFKYRLPSLIIHSPASRSRSGLIVPNFHAQFPPQQTRQTGAVPQIDPIACSSTLLLLHTLAERDPVEPLGPRDRTREPDLLVSWLLVQDILSGLEDSVLTIREDISQRDRGHAAEPKLTA